jgi:hypothetical protein
MPFGGGKKPSKIVKNWVLHHNNVPCQTVLAEQQFLVQNRTAAILQLPYPPDLTPCNFCHFSGPKTRLKGHHFTPAKEIQQNIAACLRAISKMTSRDNYSNGRTAGARCMCRRVDFQGE